MLHAGPSLAQGRTLRPLGAEHAERAHGSARLVAYRTKRLRGCYTVVAAAL